MTDKRGKKIMASIEARMTSRRLPGKVLKPILGRPSLEHEIERLRQAKSIDQIVVATTVNPTDDPIVDLCKRVGVAFYRGSEDDVLSRVLRAVQSLAGDVIVEITGDCPLLDWRVVDQCVDLFFNQKCDYVSNFYERSYPRGINAQVFSVKVLEEVSRLTQNPEDREHVSLYIYTHPEKYSIRNLKAPTDLTWPELRLTLDTPEDYELISQIYEILYPGNSHFLLEEVLTLLRKRPDLAAINRQVQNTVVQS